MKYLEDQAIDRLLARHISSYNDGNLAEFMATYHPDCISLAQIENSTKEMFDALSPTVEITQVKSATSDGPLSYVRLVQRTASDRDPSFRKNDVEQVLILAGAGGEPKILGAAPLRVQFV